MKQPELGKKVAELRKAKGLTQEELVETCNLSVRTLQRIESGEVTPRSYTLKIIFNALEYSFYDSSESNINIFGKSGYVISQWPGQVYKYVSELFNLKTNTMKKVTILAIILSVAVFTLFTICTDSKAQSISKVRKTIEALNKDYIRWFNNGQIDSCASIYAENACVLPINSPNISGKINIINNLNNEYAKGYKFIEINTETLSYADSIAVERGNWSIKFDSGFTLKGKYISEWRLRQDKWFMVNDMAGLF